ncbi:MAG: hypothetical protein ACREUI_07450, partial [Burkholderiales bacterium]
HVSSGVRSAGCNLIATRVFGMSETIAITGKSVKLFKGHYTSLPERKPVFGITIGPTTRTDVTRRTADERIPWE